MTACDISYGLHSCTARLQSQPRSVQEILLAAGQQNQRRYHFFREKARYFDIPVRYCSRKELDRLSGSGVHQGVVLRAAALAPGNEHDLAEWLRHCDMPALVLVLDGIVDPHNMGACLRTAEAAGVGCVIMPRDKTAPVNATVQKVSCGAASRLPLMVVTNLGRALKRLKQHGLWLYGLAGEAGASLYSQDLGGATALVVGAEGHGLRRLTRQHCDYLLALPMAGEMASVNVSVAAGIAMFEAVRQRQAPALP